MRIIVALFLLAGSIDVAWSLTDFTKVNFVKSFKDAEKNGGFTPLEMQAILEAHNTMRREAANGRRARMPTAAGLPLLEWDDRLAYEAQLWLDHLVKTNSYEHPKSIKISPWEYCGQNLGSFKTRDIFVIMQAFEKEVDFYTFDTNDCAPAEGYYTCGHAKQIYSEGTTHVGCQAQLKAPGSSELFVVCDYGKISTNAAPYTKGATCSACKGSYPFCLDGLCASKKVCELAGMDKCKCTKKDSECGHGASVDPATCQCTKNCPPEWVSPYCKSKCDDGQGMDGICPMMYTNKQQCVGSHQVCTKYCGNCVERGKPIGVPRASNVLAMESYPRAKNCDNAKGLTICADTVQAQCSQRPMIAAACARTCNRCRMLDGVTNWSAKCTPDKIAKCASGLFKNVCQKLCRGS